MSFSDYPFPHEDIFITDVGKEQLAYISKKFFSVDYLSSVKIPPEWPINGILYGDLKKRILVSMVVQRGNLNINVPFIVDTGCPIVYISAEVYEKFVAKHPENLPDFVSLTLHGIPDVNVAISPSVSHFAEVNILGQSFLTRDDVKFSMHRKNICLSLVPENN